MPPSKLPVPTTVMLPVKCEPEMRATVPSADRVAVLSAPPSTNVTPSDAANERSLAASDGVTLVDGGADSTATLSADGTVARISGSHFTGNITVVGTGSFEGGISGSLTRLANGTSYIIAGSNITVTSASNGAITIAS